MDRKTASVLLEGFVHQLRERSYAELCTLIGEPQCQEVFGPDGDAYQIEWESLWDEPRRKGGMVRVIVSIDDGGFWASLRPMTTSFIVAPDGSFLPTA